MASATPTQPKGKNRELPPSGAMLVAQLQLKFGIAPIQKTSRMPRAKNVMKTVNLKVATTPAMFIPTKMP